MENDTQKILEMATDQDLGILINGAVRFALGKNISMVNTIYRFLIKHYPVLDNRTLSVIINDIRWELNMRPDLYRKEIWIKIECVLIVELNKRQRTQ